MGTHTWEPDGPLEMLCTARASPCHEAICLRCLAETELRLSAIAYNVKTGLLLEEIGSGHSVLHTAEELLDGVHLWSVLGKSHSYYPTLLKELGDEISAMD